jgi:L-fucose mutarotase
MPLNGIPKCLTPELLHALSSMGHGDEIVLADAHFPASSVAKKSQCKTIEIRADGSDSLPHLLESILKFFPLDDYSAENVKTF